MPIPLAVPIALTALSTIPQWMAGYRQENRADELARGLVRPEFEIPESAKRALESAEARSQLTRLPGQDAIEGRLDQTTANKIAMIERMSMGGPTAINAAGSVFGQQMDAENELGVQAANMRLQNEAILRDELSRMSQWENQKWQYDKALPFEQKTAAIEALREGAMRNKNAAWKDIFGSAANLTMLDSFYNKGNSSWFDNIFGAGKYGSGSVNPQSYLKVNPITEQSALSNLRTHIFDVNTIRK